MADKTMMKVLCPVERNGKTYWVRSGIAFPNKDGSTNVFLDVLPHNGRLQLRAFDDRDRAEDRRTEATPF
jgi:hypothetical protein